MALAAALVPLMSKSRRSSRQYRRRITPESQAAIVFYTALTAEVLWGWNRLHSALLDLFQSLIGQADNEDSHNVASAIWHTFQSDKAQRDMLGNVAEAKLGQRSVKLKQIKWLLKKLDRFAPYRNAIVHTPVTFSSHREGQPNAINLDSESARDTAVYRLSLAGSGQRFWNNVAGDLFVLGQFSRSLIVRPKSPENDTSFPALHRPQLLSLRRIEEIDGQVSRLRGTKEPKPRRRASPQKRKS